MRSFVSLTILVSASCLIASVPAFGQAAAQPAPPQVVGIAAHVAEAALRFGLPESWIYAVLRAESAGRIGAVSSAGAMGLMQLMPGTWARQRARFGLGGDPFEPRDNIMAGTSYLREMHDRYGAPGFLAAYNAGPGRYEDWRDRGRPLPAETLAYVAKIAPTLHSAGAPTVAAGAAAVHPVRTPWTQGQLFAARPGSSDGASGGFAAAAPTAPEAAPAAPIDGLFAPVSGARPR